MIGNELLDTLYAYNDISSSINQLCDYISENPEEVKSLLSVNIPDLEKLSNDEQNFITILASIIDYKFQEYNITAPSWLYDEKLSFAVPFYLDKRLNELDKLKLFIKANGPFKTRNVFIDITGLTRM